jgi:endonuclease YncB( thermonuclease family)
VRLVEIDAPELRQPYGRQATDALKGMCIGRPAEVDSRGLDRYGRTLARVYCNGVDVNAEQVRRGWAWAFTKYLTDPEITRLETEARSARRGLWRSEHPIPPWEYRHSLP